MKHPIREIIYIHGRDYKPDKNRLLNNFKDALRHGIQRDFGEDTLEKFNSVHQDMAYYGDISNEFLSKRKEPYQKHHDIDDRKQSLFYLKKYKSEEFNKENYNKLKGKNSILESLADLLSHFLSFVKLGKYLVSKSAVDMKEYWDKNSDFHTEVSRPLQDILLPSLKENNNILLISHSLGTMIAYDLLWELSHNEEYRELKEKKLHTFITLGSPLGNETAKKTLRGNGGSEVNSYPTNISKWYNIAAEDDYIAHDETISDEFKSSNIIEDIRNYNLSLRYGKSNPHHGTGYLISPELVKIVVEWLEESS